MALGSYRDRLDLLHYQTDATQSMFHDTCAIVVIP